MPEQLPGLPRPRTLRHPGPVSDLRIEHRHAALGRHFRLALPPGRSLHEALVSALAGVAVRNASMTLLGGELQTLSYCLAQPDHSGRVVATYGELRETTAARLIFGNATLGRSAAGLPVLHCHAAFRLADGSVRGGHVLAEQTRIGAGGIGALATSLDGIELRIGYDTETRMSFLRPHTEVSDA